MSRLPASQGTRPLPPGQVIGTAGGSLDGTATWAISPGAAAAGRRGERATAQVLDRLAARLGGPTVLHDLTIPIAGIEANIDHIVAAGVRVWIVDSKLWRPGWYWTWGGTARRGTTTVPHATFNTAQIAHTSVASLLTDAEVQHPTVVVWPSNGSGRVSTRFVRTDDATVMPGSAFSRTARLVWRNNPPASPEVVSRLAALVR